MNGHLEYKSGFNVETKDGQKEEYHKQMRILLDRSEILQLLQHDGLHPQIHFTISRICTKTKEKNFIMRLCLVLRVRAGFVFHV